MMAALHRCIAPIRGGFKEKGPVSSLPWSPSVAKKFHFGRSKTNFSGFQKVTSKKKKSLYTCPRCYATGTQHFYFFGRGPVNNILRGPCQQLLTLLTLKSATNPGPLQVDFFALHWFSKVDWIWARYGRD